MRKIRPLLILLLILLGAFLLFLLFATLDDYKPEEIENQELVNEPDILQDTDTFKLVIWNIGYAGLDASMDFFYDGGKQMRPGKEGVKGNMEGILHSLLPYRESDFILLQEVDLGSKRSYKLDQSASIGDQFENHHSFFAKNYDVAFVPIPLKEPMGKVESGLLTLSRAYPSLAERRSFPGNYSWPVKLFMLDRCFLVNRFKMSDQKELVVVNTHNSAYDDGSLRTGQMDYLRNFLLEEYAQGNYVLVGGDWNQTPHGLIPKLPEHKFDKQNLTFIEEDYPAEDWIWAFDSSLPTNRRVKTPFDQASSLTTIIDFYLLSPNLQVLEIQTVELDFEFSDHQPVELSVKVVP